MRTIGCRWQSDLRAGCTGTRSRPWNPDQALLRAWAANAANPFTNSVTSLWVASSVITPARPTSRYTVDRPKPSCQHEQRHALAQVVCTFKQGRITDRGPEAQQFRASRLNLVIAAIVVSDVVRAPLGLAGKG